MKPIRTLLILLLFTLLPAMSQAAKGKPKVPAKPVIVAVKGTIMSAETNKPVPEAIITFYGRDENSSPPVAAKAIPDSDGRFTVKLPAGYYRWVVKADGYGQQDGGFSFNPKQTEDLNTYLRKQAFLSGRTVDGNGKPMPGVTITAGRWAKAVSGADGRFAMNSLDARGYEPSVIYPGRVLENSSYHHLEAGQKKDLGDLILRRAAGISVTVIPVNNTQKRQLDKIGLYISGNAVYRHVKTSPQGVIDFKDLAPGHYTINVSDERMITATRELDITEGENRSVTLESGVKPASLTIEDYTDVFLPEKAFTVKARGLWASKAEAIISGVDPEALLSSRADLHKPNEIPVGLLKKVRSFPVVFKQRKDSYTVSNRITMPALPPGAYVLELRDKDATARFGFLVTGLGLIAKSSPNGSTLLFAADLSSGKALAGVNIGSRDNRQTVTTGKDGMAEWSTQNKQQQLNATYGKNLAFMELAAIPDNGAASSTRGYIYSDRPVYRPGQTVYFKGVLRQRAGETYTLPTVEQVRITVNDSGEKAVCETDLFINKNGSFSGECALPASTALGDYAITAAGGGETWQGNFKVLEYRKPEYLVKAVPDRRFLVADDTASVKVSARYYSGSAVAGGKIKWRIYNQPAWSLGHNDDSGDNAYDGEERYSSGYSDFIGEGEAALNDNGEALIQVAAKKHDMPYTYTIEVDVTDVSSRQVSSSASISVVPSLVSLNVKAGSYLAKPDTPVDIKLRAADWEGEARALPATLYFEYQQYDKKLRLYNWKRSGSVNLKTASDGTARTSYAFPHSGYWRIMAEASDQAGRKSGNSTSVWVWKEGYNWEGSYRDLEAEFDRKSYKPGETARLIVRSPSTGGTLLLTLEGRDIQKRMSIPLKSMVQVIEIPAEKEYAPNIQVSLVTVGKGRFFNRTIPLRIDHQPGRLDIEVKSDKPVYAPGDKVRLTMSSMNSGRSVPGEFSLAVVDEAIFAVSAERREDIWQFFLGNREHLVTTMNSFPRVYLGGAAKDAAAFKAKEDDLKGIKVRKIFKDTALWQPIVMTNPDGTATAEFTLPDNLTTWRATAVGHSGSNQFGTGRDKFIARLELMARLSPPRFLIVGDELKIPGIVSSMTDIGQNAKGRFEVQGVTLLTDAEFSGIIPPRGTLRRDALIRPDKTGIATLRLLARGALTADAMELELPVLERGITRIAGGGIALHDQEGISELTLPENAVPGSAVLKLTFSPTIATNLNSAINKLVEFPYGCVEQTLSRFIPAVHARSLLTRKSWQPDKATAEKLPLAIAEGLKRLEDMQHEDGGWGWWKTDSTSITMTAHALYGLGLAKKAGLEVSDDMIKKGVKSLEQQIEHTSTINLPRAYRALSLNNIRNNAVEQKITAAWKSLPIGEQLCFAEALGFTGQRKVLRPLLEELKHGLQEDGNAAYIRDNDSESWWYGWRWGSSTIETTSSMLSLLVSQQPLDPANSKLAQFLVRHQSGGWWQTTTASAAAVTALADYVAYGNETNASYNATIKLNDNDLANYVVENGRLVSGEKVLSIPAALLKSGTNRIKLNKDNKGAAYVAAELKYIVPPEAVQSSPELKMERTLYRINSVKSGDVWRREYTLLKPGETVAPGDDIEVRLTVDNLKPLEYVIIEDRLPAGFESRESDRDQRFTDDYDYDSWFTHKERRDEKMAYFITGLPEGRHEFRHVIHPELEGKALALPTSIWPMYQPELRGESKPWQFEIKQH